MNELLINIQQKLSYAGDRKKGIWLEKFVKHGVKSRGVGIPTIKIIIKDFVKDNDLNGLPQSKKIELLNGLMKQEFSEDKLAAILLMQLHWNSIENDVQLDMISEWFNNQWISDWNICDWLCVRIISPMIDNDPQNTIDTLNGWNTDPYLWKARSSIVPFAQCKTIESHRTIINDFSSNLIIRPERFCKTAVGWVLREYSKIDKKFVQSFLEKNKKYITQEVFRNATKYFPKSKS
ncbi:MAG: hypothetical protein CVT98_06170 [Bacteroidetes bacterium HGW-Bacteroidetes-15]|nr:MAG: hypothetical protein CVT98_06170 [Bacteroidetes bacterium HGW-Bacteroidetes-15]